MKLFFTLMAAFSIAASGKAQGYKVTFQTKSYTSGIAYLAYHQGKNYNIADSAGISVRGMAVFSGKTKLVPGIYAVAFPNKTVTSDFLIDDAQDITVKADTLEPQAIVTGSPANILFDQYQKYVVEKGSKMQSAKSGYASAKTKADSMRFEKEYTNLNEELNAYRNHIIQTEPNAMLSALLLAMKEPELPNPKPKTRQDSLDNYYYYKAHYWDGVTFMDDRIVRTPFFQPKLERYYREIVQQAPDSIIKDIDYKLLLARNAPEMYKFLLNWLTDEFINPRYMGQDAVFVHLFDKYHSKGLTPWLNEKQMEAISRRAYMQMANLIGERAANLELVDTTGKVQALYDVKAEYTVLVFWDPNCGHCKQEVPRLDSIYRASWNKKNIKIYAVNTEFDEAAWKKFIQDNNLKSWTHVHQTKAMQEAEASSKLPGYKQLFDVIQTPTLYLLDAEKRIVAKKLTFLQIDDLLQVKMKSK